MRGTRWNGYPSTPAPMNLGQKRRCRRVHESISPARKQPAPVVLDRDLETEWLFDVGAGLSPWSAAHLPELSRLQRTRTPRVKARSTHIPVYAYSVTTGTHLHLESGLEHDLVRELDRRPDVTWLVAQPCRLRLPARRRGRRVEHTPDLLSLHDDGTVRLWDARPAARQDSDFALKARLTAEACAEFGWRHVVFAGLSRVRRVNLMWLHAYRRPMPWYAGSLRLLCEYVELDGTISDVLALDAGGGHVVSAMWHGIWSGQIDCDLNTPFRRGTRLIISDPGAVNE